jgi:hypothetical protein
MFMRLAAQIPNGAQALMQLHPTELTVLFEQAWNVRRNQINVAAGEPDHRSDLNGIGLPLTPPIATAPSLVGALSADAANATAVLGRWVRVGTLWDHLIYAYMVENTRIYEIFRRVVHEFLHGEKLGTPGSATTQLWLRSTEELFYRNPPPFSITSISSYIRPDMCGTRRNAYHRMFGMDLNHGRDDNSPYAYPRAEVANNEFVSTLEELLREIWVGHTNRSTTSGANPTDNARIADLATKLCHMLITRRQNGNLSREEFYFVSMMSWFHLAVSNNVAVVADLRAEGANAEQRLFKIAQKVGLPAHGLARSYFEIAQPLSDVLTLIETGVMNAPGAASAFYDPAVNPALSNLMNTIIMHWSPITGRDVKARKVATAA